MKGVKGDHNVSHGLRVIGEYWLMCYADGMYFWMNSNVFGLDLGIWTYGGWFEILRPEWIRWMLLRNLVLVCVGTDWD